MYSVFLVWALMVTFMQAVSGDEMKSRMKIATCRATCLDKFAPKDLSDVTCKEKPDCYMCWETCELFLTNYDVWGHMCGVPEICFPGCQSSCHFYHHGSDAMQKSKLKDGWSFQREFHFEADDKKNTVSLEWSAPRSEKIQPIGKLVYILTSRENVNSQWKEVKQTTEQKTTFRRPHLNFQLKIGAVAAGGLLTEKIVEYNEKPQDRMSLDDHMTSGASRSASSWWLPQISLHHGGKQSGVDAVITWNSMKEALQYEVTWRVIDYAMEITGHLHTARNSATLTLWPNALYSVQVGCFGKQGEKLSISRPLLVDTHGFQKEANHQTPKECFNVALLISSIGAVFLLIATIALLFIYKKYHASQRNTSNAMSGETQKVKCSRKPSAIILQTSNELKNKIKREFSQKTADMEPLTPACPHGEDIIDEHNDGFFAFELPYQTQKGKPNEL